MDDQPSNSDRVAVLAALERVEQQLGSIQQRIAQLEAAAPSLVGALVDALDDKARALQARGIDLDARVADVLALLERATAPETTQRALQLFAALDRAEATAAPVGLLGLLRGLSEAGVQRSLGVLLALARQLGLGKTPLLPKD